MRTGVPEAIADRRRAARPWRAVVVFGVPPAPAAISISPFRVYSGTIVITGPVAIVRSFGPAGRRVQDRSRFSGVLAWMGTSRSDQHCITCS